MEQFKIENLTFGQRIGLDQIMSNTVLTDLDKFERTFIFLHNYRPKATEYSTLITYFCDICNSIAFWTNQEATLLKYEPSDEEKQKELNSNIDYVSNDPVGNTVRALARNYNVEPADVLNWKYNKVFKILLEDLEKSKREYSNLNLNR